MFKIINHQNKLKCGVLLDEMPTIYLKGIDQLISTARSNKVAIVIGAQDKSQLRRDYGEKEAEVIFNTVGNVFSGQVNGRTAEDLSRAFGKQFRRRESQTQSIDSESVNVSFQLEDIMPASKIETLSQGTFFGKVADDFGQEIEDKFFCGKIHIDMDKFREKKQKRKPLPRLTDFGEADIDEVLARNFNQVNDDVVRIVNEEYSRFLEYNDRG